MLPPPPPQVPPVLIQKIITEAFSNINAEIFNRYLLCNTTNMLHLVLYTYCIFVIIRMHAAFFYTMSVAHSEMGNM